MFRSSVELGGHGASHKICLLSCAFDFGEGLSAPFTNGGISWVFAYMGRIVPATFALSSVRAFDFDGKSWKHFALYGACGSRRFNLHLRNNEKRRQHVASFLQQFL